MKSEYLYKVDTVMKGGTTKFKGNTKGIKNKILAKYSCEVFEKTKLKLTGLKNYSMPLLY